MSVDRSTKGPGLAAASRCAGAGPLVDRDVFVGRLVDQNVFVDARRLFEAMASDQPGPTRARRVNAEVSRIGDPERFQLVVAVIFESMWAALAFSSDGKARGRRMVRNAMDVIEGRA